MAANRRNETSQRLNEAFAHLWVVEGIRSVSDFARALGYDRTYISNAMNGKMADFPPSIFTRLCQRFPNVFDMNYLLTGEGSLLADGAIPTPGPVPSTDAAAGIVELAARLVAEVEALRKELEAERRALAHEREELRFTMELLRMSIQDDNALPVAAESAPETLVKKEEK